MPSRTGPRMTLPTQLVLRAIIADSARPMYGLEICRAAGLPSGTIHPILARLEGFGWLESHWEQTDPHLEGRPRRRYYRLTTYGARQAHAALARVRTPESLLARPRPGFAGGAP